MDKKQKQSNTFTIQIEKEITHYDIDCIIINALEGGIGYWSREYKVVEEGQKDFLYNEELWVKEHCLSMHKATQTLLGGGSILFHDVEGEEEGNEEEYTLTLDKLLKGIKLNIIQRDRHYNIEDYDGEDCDCVIQYALFGELQFG